MNLQKKIFHTVENFPQKIAIKQGDKKVSYRDLEEYSNKIANFFKQQKIFSANILLMMNRSPELIIAILGVLKADGIFVPLDEKYPENRLKMMIKEVDAQWVIAKSENLEKMNKIMSSLDRVIKVLLLDEKTVPEGYEFLEIYLLDAISSKPQYSDEITNPNCYIYFTSGSTGRPKGVLGRHRSLMHFINWEIEEFGISKDFNFSQLTSPSFDPFLRDIFVALCSGATCVLPEDEETIINPLKLCQWIEREKINLIHMTPSLFKSLMTVVDNNNVFSSLKYIILAGEKLRGNDIKKFVQIFADRIQLVNMYGPTETTLAKFFYRVKPKDQVRINIPVGKPISKAEALILDQNLKRCDVGVIGEVYIRTPFISSGYYKHPEWTKEVFLKNPFTDNPRDYIYKTGDLGIILPDGNLELIGRADHQVKIRGMRIEPGEIENCLLNHPDIIEAVVIDREDETGDKYLCAYLVLREKNQKGSMEGETFGVETEQMVAEVAATSVENTTWIKEYLATGLPDYMIPSHFVFLNQMPLLPNGKVDRNSLPEPEKNLSPEEEFIPPTDEMEEKLVEIWSRVLGIKQIGIINDFFALGGHSLKAARLLTEIYREFGVDVPLRVIFEQPRIKELAAYLRGKEKNYKSIHPAELKEVYPLSSAQRRLYILHQYDRNNLSYNLPKFMVIEGEFSKNAFEKAIRDLIKRHEALRTSFELKDGEPVQRIHDEVPVDIHYYRAEEKEVEKIIIDFVKPFDLNQAPLFRTGVLEVAENKNILMFDIHHIIADGTSMGILINDFIKLFTGEELPELKIQYKDFAEWQNRNLTSDLMKSQEKYWVDRFMGEIPVLNLPTDFSRPSVMDFKGDTVEGTLGESLTDRVKKLATEKSITVYMLLLAAYNLLLSKYSGQEEIIVGSPIAGRSHPDLNDLVGMFVNTLALKNYPTGEKRFGDFLVEVSENVLKAFENQDYQFEMLIEKLDLKRDLSRNPIFDTMFALHNLMVEKTDKENFKIYPLPFTNKVAKFDLSLNILESTEELRIRLEYRTSLFNQKTAERIVNQYINILEQIVTDPDRKIKDIEIITREEKEIILKEFNNTQAFYPEDRTVVHLFAETVSNSPQDTALIFENKSLSYQEFNARVNGLARILRQKGVGPEVVVGVLSNRSPEMITAIYAIIKAGGVYLPISPDYPEERIRFMLEDSQTKILLVQKGVNPGISFAGETLLVDFNEIEKCVDDLEIINRPEDAMYVIYTSGSTGKPKGVVIEHRSVVNRLNWMQKKYPITQNDTILQKTPFTFDVSVWEIFWWAITGSKVVLLQSGGEKEPEAIITSIEKYGVTTMHFVPSMLNTFLQYVERTRCFNRLKNLRQVFASGEALTSQLVEKFIHYLTNTNGTTLHNLYGPTEATVDVSYYDCTEIEEIIPIGKPIDNINLYVIDKYQKLLPVGIPGELCIAGVGLARGYLNRAELIAEKFVTDPFVPGRKMYKTGDLVKWLPDGNIQFLGRIDHQVKIRGFRIELGEIENKLLNHPDIIEAVVVAKKDGEENYYLCAYLVTCRELSIMELRNYLSEDLPEYMIPSYFVALEKMPLSPNGKIDRKALPEPDESIKTGREYTPPADLIEEKLVTIWSELLGRKEIGVNDNFFEIGGHSLKATQMAGKVYKEFGVEMPLKIIFDVPTIRGVAHYIKTAQKSDYQAIEPLPDKEYYPVSSAQRRLYILHKIEGDHTGYNMPGVFIIEGELNKDRFEKSFNRLIERHEAFRTSFELVEDTLVQKIHTRVDFAIKYLSATEDQLEKIVSDFIKPFDLSKPPLLRVMLVRLNIQKHVLVFDMHHIISDGTSINILIEDFVKLYEGQPLENLPIQYKDFASWQNKLLAAENSGKQEEYWLKKFADEVPTLNLPADFKRPLLPTFEGDRYSFTIETELLSEIKKIISSRECTLFMFLLAVYNILLAKYTGQNDIIIGTPVAGRHHPDLERVIGVFINTLALRNKPEGDKSFKEFLQEVKEDALRAYENQDYQFETLVEKLTLERDPGRNPLFDVMLILQNMGVKDTFLSQLKVTPYGFTNRISKFDITLTVTEKEDQLGCVFEYSTALFREDTIKRMARHFKQLIKDIILNPLKPIKELEILSHKEKDTLLSSFNKTQLDYSHELTIHQLIEKEARKHPDKTALVCNNRSLTYRELNSMADELATILIKKGGQRESVIGLMVHRSVEMIIAMLAIMKAGGAYLPLDPGYPEDRINYMLEDSKAEILITERNLFNKVKFSHEVICIDELDLKNSSNIQEIKNINSANDLIYLIYTSGSTGQPKGTMLEHRSVHNFINGVAERIAFQPEKTILSLTTISFDIFVLESLLPLCRGMRIVLATEEEQQNPEKIKRLIIEHRVQMIQLTPSRLKVLIENSKDHDFFSSLTEIMVGGESFPEGLLHQLQSLTTARIYNMYGPTETTVWSTIADLTEEKEVTIGTPIANTIIHILDDNYNLVPPGVYGQLFIAGAGLARGYLNRPELTEERFVSDPFIEGQKMYKTGDLARWLVDGKIQFAGRIDDQVKIRGYRIEIKEVETNLNTFPEIKESVVVAKRDEDQLDYLVAYYVADTEISVSELRNHLLRFLPDYMVPSYYVRIDKIPLTPNGKVNRRALPEITDKRPTLLAEYIAPVSDIEKRIAGIWKDTLKVERVGIGDNFFDLGGNSILLVKMHAQLEKVFSLRIPITELFANPTIAKLSKYIEENKNLNEEDKVNQEKLILEKRYWEEEFVQTYSLLTLPPDYYSVEMPGEDKTAFEIAIAGEMFLNLKGMADEEKIDVEDILTGMYIYLFSEITGEKDIIIKAGLKKGSEILFPLRVNLEDIEDFIQFFELINEKYRQAEKMTEMHRLAGIKIQSGIQKNYSPENIIPAITFITHGSFIEGDLVCRVIRDGNKINLIFEYNGFKLKKKKVEELISGYVNLIQSLLKQYYKTIKEEI